MLKKLLEPIIKVYVDRYMEEHWKNCKRQALEEFYAEAGRQFHGEMRYLTNDIANKVYGKIMGRYEVNRMQTDT